MRSTLAAMFVLIFDVSWTDYSQILRVIAAFEIVRLFLCVYFHFAKSSRMSSAWFHINISACKAVFTMKNAWNEHIVDDCCCCCCSRMSTMEMNLEERMNLRSNSMNPIWQAVSMHTHTQKGFGSFANPEYFIYSCSMSITSSHAWPSILSGLMVDKWWFYVCAECVRRDFSFAISCIRSLFVVHWTKEQKKNRKAKRLNTNASNLIRLTSWPFACSIRLHRTNKFDGTSKRYFLNIRLT